MTDSNSSIHHRRNEPHPQRDGNWACVMFTWCLALAFGAAMTVPLLAAEICATGTPCAAASRPVDPQMPSNGRQAREAFDDEDCPHDALRVGRPPEVVGQHRHFEAGQSLDFED